MKGINIKGKNYVMVNERLKHFRTSDEFKGWSLTTEIINLDNETCVIKAVICDENGVIKATGLAQEDKSSSMINKTSFVENCETSAWGRALGNLGIGIDESIASAEEVDMAIRKQEQAIVGGSFILNGGKYDGKTIQEVVEIDVDYIYYCLKNGKNETVKQNMTKALIDNGCELPEISL